MVVEWKRQNDDKILTKSDYIIRMLKGWTALTRSDSVTRCIRRVDVGRTYGARRKSASCRLPVVDKDVHQLADGQALRLWRQSCDAMLQCVVYTKSCVVSDSHSCLVTGVYSPINTKLIVKAPADDDDQVPH